MLLNSLIILILSYSITSRRDKSILYSRTAITVLIITAFIAYDNFLFLNEGIGVVAVLLKNLTNTYSFYIFIALVIIVTSVILLGLYVRDYIINLFFNYITFGYLRALRRKLSFFLDKSKNKWLNIKIHLSISFTLAFFIFIPYLANINIINYMQALLWLILLGIIMHYIYPSYPFLRNELPGIEIVPGYIDRVISAIVNESIIPDYFTCILVFTGLSMLVYHLTLDNKSGLSFWNRINYFWNNKKMLLLIILVIWIFSVTLSYLGIVVINKDSVILFIITVFSRIVFFKLTYAVIFNLTVFLRKVFYKLTYPGIHIIYTKNINSNLFSLNILTVLFIFAITYLNVFIIIPIISLTCYLFFNDLYTSMENLCTSIKNDCTNYSNNLYIWIKYCEEFLSYFVNFCIKELDKWIVPMLDYKYIFNFIIDYIHNYSFFETVHCSSPKLNKNVKIFSLIPLEHGYDLETYASSGKWDNIVKTINNSRSEILRATWKVDLVNGKYINPSSPMGFGMGLNNYPWPIHVFYNHLRPFVDPFLNYIHDKIIFTRRSNAENEINLPTVHYYPDTSYMPITVYQGDFDTLYVRPFSKYSMSYFKKNTWNSDGHYKPLDKIPSEYSKAWCSNTSCSIPVDSDSSSTYNSNDRDSYSPGKSNVRDSSSTAKLKIYNTTSGLKSFCNNTSNSDVTVNGDVGNDFHGTNNFISADFKSGLSDIGSGIAVGGGLIGGSIIAAKSESSTIAKLGIMVAGGVIGGASSIFFSAIHMISRKKLNNNRPEVVESLEELNTIVKAVQARASSTKAKPKSGESKYVDYVYNEPSIDKGPDIVTDLFL